MSHHPPVRSSCRVLLLAVTLLLASPAGGAMAATDPAARAQPVLQIYGDRDGLPHNTVSEIALDREGRLWIGTHDGVATFDGRAWRTIELPQPHKTHRIRSLLPAYDGGLWIGTEAGGLVRWREEGAQSIEQVRVGASDLPLNRVNAILELETPQGERELWAGTHAGGIFRRRGGEWHRYGTEEGLPTLQVWSLLATRDAAGATTIWAGTLRGLVRLEPDGNRFAPVPGAPDAPVVRLTATRDDAGRPIVWAATFGKGLHRLQGTAWTRWTRTEGLPNDFVIALSPSRAPDGRPGVWVGTDGGGVARVSEGVDQVFDVQSGLSATAAVYALLETTTADGVSALWIGMRNGGLARLRRHGWKSIVLHDAGARLPVSALLETTDPQGNPRYWFGTDGGGLFRLDGDGLRRVESPGAPLPNAVIRCLLARGVPGREEIWVGTRNHGLLRFAAGRWQTFDRAGGALPDDIVEALLETSEAAGESTLWVGTRTGLVRFDGRRWERVATPEWPLESRFQTFAATRDPNGGLVLWVGTDDGLGRLENGSWRLLGAEAGLPNPIVRSLHAGTGPEGEPALWVGTTGGGVALIDLAAESRPPILLDRGTLPGLPNDVIHGIAEDATGSVYLLTNRGVARLTPEPNPGPDGASYRVTSFNHEDGLPLNQGNRGAVMRDRHGRIWVGTVGGAAFYEPGSERPDQVAKRLLLRGRLLPEGRLLESGERLSYQSSSIRFDYTLLSFFREETSAYRSRLVGLEAQPTSWGNESAREFVHLPAGNYRFQAWGRDYAGNVTGPVEIAFAIRPAPWQTLWARLALLVLIVGLVALIVRHRSRRHARRERELTEQVEARTRQLHEANLALMKLSYADPVTSVANRRRFDEALEHEWRRAERMRIPLALIMIDVDRFKEFNDTYGHQRGDEVLRTVATALNDGLKRSGDLLGRYGGEEFGVILPDTDLDGAVLVAEQLRRRIKRLAIAHDASHVAPHVTISCGVASLEPDKGGDIHLLLRQADAALYRAKELGRDRVAT